MKRIGAGNECSRPSRAALPGEKGEGEKKKPSAADRGYIARLPLLSDVKERVNV